MTLRATLLAVLALLLAGPALAQEKAGENGAPPGRIERLKQELDAGKPVVAEPTAAEAGAKEEAPKPDAREKRNTGLLPDLVDKELLDEEGVRSLQGALKAYYDYRISGFDHRARVFEWQLFSARLIFALVIGIVGIGLYFSWLQFMAGFREKGGALKLDTSLEASPTGGVKVSSPVLGVIILGLSLAFFYLYLVHVYPIEEIF